MVRRGPVATDTDAFFAGEFRWLGWPGHRFRKDHRGVSYLVACGVAAVCVALGAVFTPTFLVPGGPLWDWTVRTLCLPVWVFFVAKPASKAVMRRITMQRTPRWWVRTIYLELTAKRPPPPSKPAAVTFRHKIL